MMGGGDLEYSLNLENDDFKYVSGLSAILVATIQEAKDRISQIEYIFCSQIFPNFQSKSNSLQKIYLDAKKEEECEWKEKEKHLLEQIEQLRVEKQKAIEENQALKFEKEKSPNEKTDMLIAVITNQKMRIDAEVKRHEELEREFVRKSKEVEEGMELQNKLVELVQTKANMIVDKGRQLKMQEDKTNELLAKVKSLERRVEELQEEVRVKTERVAEEKEPTENMRRRIMSLSSMIEDNEKLKTEHEEEKKKLIFKLDCLEKNVSGLQKQLNEKTEETERGRVSQEELLEQIDMKDVEILKQKQQLVESENDKNLHFEKLTSLEEKVDELQARLDNTGKEAEIKVLYERLLQQIESKEAKLLAERKKYNDLLDYYKKLKHAHSYICAKYGLTTENMLPCGKLEDETGSLKHQQNSTNSTDVENKNLDTSVVAADIKKVKIEHESGNDSVDDEMVKLIPVTSCKSPTRIYVAPKKFPFSVKSAQLVGTKRPASTWIATRSHHGKDGPDPHDDFLDTPLENLRGNFDRAMKEDVRDLHVPVKKNEGMDPGSSDDETQDVNVDPHPAEQQMPVPMAGKRNFKYTEPVRKKAERENLKGVECKQCKKFYDAVLPNNGGQNADGNRQNLRCEHHDGVSRHRYKHMPPMTPEGFWNIGFESEM